MKLGQSCIGVAVIFFCHDGKGNFLMALRSTLARDENGRWDIGGGALNFGEDEITTLKREIKEEYCTNVLTHQFLGYRNVIRQHNGKKTHWLVLDFKVLVNPRLVKNGEPKKFEDVKWFTIKTLPKNAHSQFPKFLALYKKQLFS